MDAVSARGRMLGGLPTARVLDIAGIATSVWEAGDGPPIVLLHGGIECGGVIWAPILTRLTERHRVVVPDLPGLGESAPVDRLDAEAFGRWFLDLLRQTGLRRPMLVAHSLGGSLAARFAVRHSDSLGRLVIYAAPAVGPYRMPIRLRYVAVRFAIRPTAKNNERFERFALHDRDATRRRDPAWFDAFGDYTRARAVVPHIKRTMHRLITNETKQVADSDLARITAPTALLWGRHDRIAPLSLGRAAAARHGWRLHVIEGVGHVPHIEAPDAFLAELETIAGVPG